MNRVATHPLIRTLLWTALLSVVLLPVLISVASGGEPHPLIVTPAGQWYVLVDADGVPYLQKVTQVFSFTTVGVEPQPTPPAAPPAVVFDPQVVERARTASVGVQEFDDAQRMALAYDAFADHLKAEQVTAANVFRGVVLATDTLLNASGTKAKWEPWRAAMTALTTELTTAGKLDSRDEIYTYLKSVREGLQRSVPESHPALTLAEGVKVVDACFRIVEKLGE